MNTASTVVVAGGGAAGFFAAITCAEENPQAKVVLLEKTGCCLSKVRISGGGRCNVTHACFDPRQLAAHYPRGEKALIGAFHRFQPRDTVDWFEARGVNLKTEADGRIFPVTDNSQTIIDCLTRSAAAAGVKTLMNTWIESALPVDGRFELTLNTRDQLRCDALMLATGGCRTPALAALPVSLGHTLASPVPSLFTFHTADDWPRELAGISLPSVEASVPEARLRASGPFLFTHTGVSGPAILKLSAWGARELHVQNYEFDLLLNFRPDATAEQLDQELRSRGQAEARKLIVNTPLPGLPGRLWSKLVERSGAGREERWAELSRARRHALVQQIQRNVLRVSGKSLNKDEFVTCGGIPLAEVNFKTMESRVCPGLYFAGEILDIDGLTGGFNFQAAWTTGWIAGQAMAARQKNSD